MFIGDLKTTKIDDKYYRLITNFTYRNAYMNISVTVPMGFKTDFASTPDWLQGLFHPTSKYYSKGSVIHDYMYATKKFDRKKCDKIFFEAMKEEADTENPRTAWFMRWSFYLVVRIFGAKHYG